jgi:uncharacterized membrane protein
MATVTAVKFPTAEGAETALGRLQDLEKTHSIKLHDAAILSWPVDKKTPRIRQLGGGVGENAVGGMFWGLLLGCVFFAPLFGMAVGTAIGALVGAFRDYGIDEDFINRVRDQVAQGTSALFLLTSDASIERVVAGMKDVKFEIIATNLSQEQEQKLREAFGQE